MTTYSQSEANSMSDNALDAAYALAFDNKDSQSTTVLELEILDRLASVRSFISGTFGFKRFPLYDSRGHFQQVEIAQTAVSDSAANVAGKISGFSLSVAVPLILAAIVIFIVYKKMK